MSKRIHILGSACNMIGGLIGVPGWLLRFARLMLVPKAVLAAKSGPRRGPRHAAKLLAAQSQLAACVDAMDRKKAPKPRFKLSFRLLWIALSRLLSEWRKLAHVMRPDTVIAWHRGLSKLIWRRKSRLGRPPVSREMQALIPSCTTSPATGTLAYTSAPRDSARICSSRLIRAANPRAA